MPGLAVVTGANRGLGNSVAQSLAENGYSVLAVCRTQAAAMQAVESLPGSGHSGVAVDLTATAGVDGVVGAVTAMGVPLELLINNAGVYLDGWDRRAWDESVAVNFVAPMALTEALLRSMAPGGAVINVSSGYGNKRYLSGDYLAAIESAETIEALAAIPFNDSDRELAEAFKPCYKVTKAMLNRATQVLAAREDNDVAFMAVDPGWCRTRMGGDSAPRSQEDGAASVLWAALHTSPRPSGIFSEDGRRLEW